ncbi:MAG: YjgP/YjgQ family permease [Opitutales bacterium]|nr:YjgP/YjgQ family permease [Opitutales bacterium]
MFSLVDRYVFFEWIKIFCLVLGAMFGLQMIVEIQDSFTDLLNYDASVGQVVFYYLVLAPSFLTLSVPAAILVSILYALGIFHRNNEFLAFRAAGMSVSRITRTLWFAGFAFSASMWFLNASLIPWSVEASRKLWNVLEYSHEAKTVGAEKVGLVYNLAFDNRKENRMWFINRYSEYKQLGYGVSVSIMDEDRHEIRRVTATEGYYSELDGFWIFLEGRDSKFAAADGEMLRTLPFERLEAKEIDDDPGLMLLFGERPKDLSFLELSTITKSFAIEEHPKVLDYQVRLHALMAGAASCLIVTGLAIPFAVSGVRVNPAVGISKSIALFFGYYILVNVLNSLGKQEILSPEVAAWAPNVFMVILTYVLIRRVR